MPASQTAPAGTAPLARPKLSADVNVTGSIAIAGDVQSAAVTPFGRSPLPAMSSSTGRCAAPISAARARG